MSPQTWKMDIHRGAEISKELHKEDSNQHSPYLQQKRVTRLRQSMENFDPKGMSLRKIWAQVKEDRQEQQLELNLCSSSSCQWLQALISNSLPVHATCSQGEIDAFVSAVKRPGVDTGCGRISGDPHQHPYTQGQHPSERSTLRATSYFPEPPFINSCSCWWLGSLASTRAGVGYHHPTHISSTDSGPSARLPWAWGHRSIAIACRWPAGRGPGGNSADCQSLSTFPPARTGSGQPGHLLLQKEMLLLWGGRVSRSLSSARAVSPCPPWRAGTAETRAQPEATAARVLSQPKSPTQLLPTHISLPSLLRAGQLSPEGSSQDNFQTIQYKWSLQTYFFTVSSCPEAPFPSVHPAGAQQNGGCFLFLWKTERKTTKKNSSVANSCNLSPTVLDVFLHPLPSFLLQCIMQKSQISF